MDAPEPFHGAPGGELRRRASRRAAVAGNDRHTGFEPGELAGDSTEDVNAELTAFYESANASYTESQSTEDN